ncbi:MAG: virulence RhuM family protein [Candidatus Moraniibacteriota bacterium]|nr:MAG: virulence RhuM family protein [Candidatus Moranbacteria bacterium]
MKKEIIIFQSKNGEIEFKGDLKKETLWASLQQIADLFGRDKSVISRHIKNIFKEEELHRDSVVAFFATTASDGKTYQVEYFDLDVILSVGYRVNSVNATKFRQWATKTLRQHIVTGYTINKKRITKNYDEFLRAIESVQKLLPKNGNVKAGDTLELVKMFADTWLSLNAYDTSTFPKRGMTKKQAKITAKELENAIATLKYNLQRKEEATELFAQEKQKDAVSGISGNVFQSFFGRDAYETLEEKSAHLLYFFVKNHPFTDGNKRSGAFAFVWFLNKVGILHKDKMSPQALTALTLLVAESDPKDKDKMIGLILQLLKK